MAMCAGCGTEKVATEFYVDRSRPRGRVAKCRSCYARTQATVTRMKPWRREQEAKGNAIKRGVEWALTREDFMAFWQQPCSYCADPIPTVGLDRFDNGKGYVRGNVVPCCAGCNSMKSVMTAEEFFERCKRIVTNMTANAGIACGEA